MSTCCGGSEKDITIPFGGNQENLDDRNRFALEHENWAHGEQVKWVCCRLKGYHEEKQGSYGM